MKWCIHTHRSSFRSPMTFGSFRPRLSWPVVLWKTRYDHLAWKIQCYKWLYHFDSFRHLLQFFPTRLLIPIFGTWPDCNVNMDFAISCLKTLRYNYLPPYKQLKWSPLIQLSLHSFASSPEDTFTPSFLSCARSRSGGEIILTTCPNCKPSLPCCFNYLQIPHFKVHNCHRRFPCRLTVGTRLNDAVMPIMLWLIVINLKDTRPNVGPPGLGEAGETQSIVYKN